MARVFIVEDHEGLRAMIRELLERTEGFEVCGSSGSAEAAMASLEGAQADIALIDVSLPGMNGIELVRRLQDREPRILCVMLSGHRASGYVADAGAAGARGYVAKGAARELVDTLRHVLEGGTRFPTFKPNSKQDPT